ncbi:MAG: cysteine synthase family protein [Deltaproteobacteria bacterium]|jgi:cysteine synthase A|nr:cysteine synthase family protein [Deltaproteobacteria bacterium]
MRFQHKTSALIGYTPMIRLESLRQRHGCLAEIVIKLEYLNPSGSMKDRVAKLMVDEAEARSILRPHSGQTLVEATAGNTGVSLAFIAAIRGYKTIFASPEESSAESRRLLAGLADGLALTPASGGMSAALAEAGNIVLRTPGAVRLDQFSNPANLRAHYNGTGPELWEQCGGKVDIFVGGIGSGGSISGIGRYLKECSKTVKIYGVEPRESPLLSAGSSSPHGLHGLGMNFVPPLLDRSVLDGLHIVSVAQALETARELFRLEGVMAGISSGAALHVALELARKPENRGKRIVCLAYDGSARYLSTPLFDSP